MYNKDYIKKKLKPLINDKFKYAILFILIPIIFLYLSYVYKSSIRILFYIALIADVIYLFLNINNFKCLIDYITLDILVSEVEFHSATTTYDQDYKSQLVIANHNGKTNYFQYFGELDYGKGDVIKIVYLKRSKYIIDSELIKKNEKIKRKKDNA